jgi:hypothetical protein
MELIMKYEILDQDGQVINTVRADQAFVDARYPGKWRLIEEEEAEEPAAPIPTEFKPRRILTRLAFRNRFTAEEKATLYTVAKENVIIQIFLDDLQAAEEVDLDDMALVAGIDLLETSGLIDKGRAAEILT